MDILRCPQCGKNLAGYEVHEQADLDGPDYCCPICHDYFFEDELDREESEDDHVSLVRN